MDFISAINEQQRTIDFAQLMRVIKAIESKSGSCFELCFVSDLLSDNLPENDLINIDVSGNKIKLSLAINGLCGNHGVIPDYINDEIIHGLFNDELGLKEFIDVFNQKIYQLSYKIQTSRWLLMRKQQGELQGLLSTIASSLDKNKFFKYAFIANQGGTSNLALINQVINDVFKYNIQVKPRMNKRYLLPKDSITRLGSQQKVNNQLGFGFLLGTTCHVYFRELNILIRPQNNQQLNNIKQSSNLTENIINCVEFLLNEYCHISVYLLIKRSYLTVPQLSANSKKAFRLGEVDYFPMKNAENNEVKILMKSA